ncbi:hypothetical protein OYC64_011721 [Pagothenia borchgrevinki]|uniref:DUF4371 domain-containing protein n=1 Tax=Pagothenia borchgrevinki TaxID=8213 RepID=A0ABD2FGF8_PAGBO
MAKQAKLKNYFFKPSRSNDDNTDNEMAIPPAVNETVDALAPDRKKQRSRALREVKAPDFVTGDGIYRHGDSVDDMEKAIDEVLIKQLDEKLKKSDFIGIIIDETVNITVDKKLIIYVFFGKL